MFLRINTKSIKPCISCGNKKWYSIDVQVTPNIRLYFCLNCLKTMHDTAHKKIIKKLGDKDERN